MILQNISKAIREQNYYAVALEFVIVIAGVVIGFQINAWAEHRTSRIAEFAFYVRLNEELKEFDELQDRSLDRRRRAYGDLADAVAILQSPDGADLSREQCYAIVISSHATVGVSNLASVDELLRAEGLDLISDRLLRQRLAQFIGEAERLQEYRVVDVDLVSLQLEFPELMEVTSYIQDNGEVRLAASCDTGAMRAHRGFRNALMANFDWQDSLVNYRLVPFLQSRVQLSERLAELLERET